MALQTSHTMKVKEILKQLYYIHNGNRASLEGWDRQWQALVNDPDFLEEFLNGEFADEDAEKVIQFVVNNPEMASFLGKLENESKTAINN